MPPALRVENGSFRYRMIEILMNYAASCRSRERSLIDLSGRLNDTNYLFSQVAQPAFCSAAG